MARWLFKGEEFTLEIAGEAVAFVYRITNLENGRMYLGQKLLSKAATRQRNNKKRKVRIESDWTNYWGSNRELQEDVKRLGEDRFKREILHLAMNKAEANFLELMEQMKENAILRDDYYNSFIGRRIGAKGLSRLRELLLTSPQ